MQARRIGIAVGVAAAGVAAGVVGAKVVAARVRSNPDPYPDAELRREPAGETTWVERPDGTRLRVVSAGSGPTVVLAHDFSVNLASWSLVWPRLLERGYRVVAFDLRGHGQSMAGRDGGGSRPMAGDLLAVLEAVDAHDAVLVGHSAGGFVALRAVLDQPGVAARVAGVVLVSSFAGDLMERAGLMKFQLPAVRFGLPQRASANRLVGTVIASRLCGPHPSPALVELVRETLVDLDAGEQQIVLAAATESMYAQIDDVAVPAVVITGTHDRVVPSGHAARLADGIPKARLVRLDGVGHVVPWEAPDAVVAAVESLVRGPEAR